MKKLFVILLFSFLLGVDKLDAQCTMCKTTAENSVKGENTAGKGLNDGIVFLMIIPYLSAGVIGLIWYRSYKAKQG